MSSSSAIEELLFNTRQLVRNGFPNGLGLGQFESQYKRLFSDCKLPRPSSVASGCGTWLEVFTKCSWFREWFRITQTQDIFLLPKEEPELEAYFRANNYRNYVLVRYLVQKAEWSSDGESISESDEEVSSESDPEEFREVKKNAGSVVQTPNDLQVQDGISGSLREETATMTPSPTPTPKEDGRENLLPARFEIIEEVIGDTIESENGNGNPHPPKMARLNEATDKVLKPTPRPSKASLQNGAGTKSASSAPKPTKFSWSNSEDTAPEPRKRRRPIMPPSDPLPTPPAGGPHRMPLVKRAPLLPTPKSSRHKISPPRRTIRVTPPPPERTVQFVPDPDESIAPPVDLGEEWWIRAEIEMKFKPRACDLCGIPAMYSEESAEKYFNGLRHADAVQQFLDEKKAQLLTPDQLVYTGYEGAEEEEGELQNPLRATSLAHLSHWERECLVIWLEAKQLVESPALDEIKMEPKYPTVLEANFMEIGRNLWLRKLKSPARFLKNMADVLKYLRYFGIRRKVSRPEELDKIKRLLEVTLPAIINECHESSH